MTDIRDREKISESADATTADRRAVRTFRIASVLLVCYALVFLLISVDVLVRLWDWKDKVEPRVFQTLVHYESSRDAVTLLAVGLIAVMVVRRATAEWRPFVLGFAFLAVWHAKAFAFAGFPGAVQEAVATWLRDRHVHREILVFWFASPAWALWAAAACFVAFSARFPRPLSASDVLASGAHDRTGMLRTNTLAGADIGAAFRRLSATLLARGWLNDLPLALATTCWIFLFQWIGRYRIGVGIGAAALVIAAGIIVANLRVAAVSGEAAAHVVRSLRNAVVMCVGLFAASAAASLVPGETGSLIGALLLAFAPAAAVLMIGYAVFGSPRSGGLREISGGE